MLAAALAYLPSSSFVGENADSADCIKLLIVGWCRLLTIKVSPKIVCAPHFPPALPLNKSCRI